MSTLVELQTELQDRYRLPSPYQWKLENYCSDYDAGFWTEGSGVKVGVTRPHRFISKFRTGTLIVMVSPTGGVDEFCAAAAQIYEHRSLKDRGVII